MKPLDQLTANGRLRRMATLAHAALAQYPIAVERCELFARDTNLIYRVRASDGQHYALRLASPGWRTVEDLQAEALWLEALAAQTDIPAPRIMRSKQDERMITISSAGVPTPHQATLTTWLPGTLLGKQLTENNLEKMGDLFARLHIHGKQWQPPAGFTTRRFDRMLSRGEPDILLDEARQAIYTPRTRERLRETRQRVDAAYAALDPNDLRVIHCDLWHDNIKVHRGQLQPFDFEDTVWGYRLHDIAMAMLDLAEVVERDRYEALLAAFQHGYTRHLDWPAGDLLTLQLGRMLWRLNWVARFQPQHLPSMADFNADLFERCLAQGKLVPPLRPR